MREPELLPSVTVITAVFNGEAHLLDCLQSVAAQRSVLVEHIVIDGASTDGTIAILQNWSSRLQSWISEPDLGISDAMNKGIRLARGEWILFLHSDDYLPSADALRDALEALSAQGQLEVASFPVLFGTPPLLTLSPPREAGFLLNWKLGMCHQGILTKRNLLSDLGMFDTDYKICMDYNFFLKAYRAKATFSAFATPALAVVRDTGISSRLDWKSLRKRLAEEKRVHVAYAPNRLWRFAYRLYWFVYLPYRWMKSILSARALSPGKNISSENL